MFGWFKRRQGQAGAWSSGPAPENTVLIVGKYGQQFTGGDGRPIQFPPEVAFAWCKTQEAWIDFKTGHQLAWAPDLWMVLPDMPGPAAPALPGEKIRAKKGGFGL